MLIGISGGIGSGKSVVSRLLRLQGHFVYDCDAEARRIMNESDDIKTGIRDRISPRVTDGIRVPDRKMLAEIVFNDENARKALNEIVHAAVRADLQRYVASCQSSTIWVEAAILAESGLADMCDRIWRVTAPVEMRIRRITARDNLTVSQACKRMSAQSKEEKLLDCYASVTDVIYNDDSHSVLQQVEALGFRF